MPAEFKPVVVPQPPSGEGGLLSWSRDITTFLQLTLQQSGMEWEADAIELNAGTGPQTVLNHNVTSSSRIVLFPTNSDAADLMGLIGSTGVIQKISTWTSSVVYAPPTGDGGLVPIDGASTSVSYTPVTASNSVLLGYFGGIIQITSGVEATDDGLGLRFLYAAATGNQSSFYDHVSSGVDHHVLLTTSIIDVFTTTAGPDTIKINTVQVAGNPLFLVGTQRTLLAVEFNNAGSGTANTGNLYVDTKTVATGAFNINWTGTATGNETFDYIIMHMRAK